MPRQLGLKQTGQAQVWAEDLQCLAALFPWVILPRCSRNQRSTGRRLDRIRSSADFQYPVFLVLNFAALGEVSLIEKETSPFVLNFDGWNFFIHFHSVNQSTVECDQICCLVCHFSVLLFLQKHLSFGANPPRGLPANLLAEREGRQLFQRSYREEKLGWLPLRTLQFPLAMEPYLPEEKGLPNQTDFRYSLLPSFRQQLCLQIVLVQPEYVDQH